MPKKSGERELTPCGLVAINDGKIYFYKLYWALTLKRLTVKYQIIFLQLKEKIDQEGLNKIAIFPFKAYPNTKLWNYALQLGYTPEQLEYYDTPDVRSLIMSGMSTEDASRDGIAQHSQLSKIPTAELNNICQIAMNDFNNKKRI